MKNNFTYLALGDSYTIGEQVLLSESFPYQTVQFLRNSSDEALQINAPEIIAKTGFTTNELIAAIEQTTFLVKYDFVSLLIGVNNQYRGLAIDNFKESFSQLLQMAIAFAGNNYKNVFVISIPDWGVTPFAEGRDRNSISIEIDAYNEVCETITKKLQCNFINITSAQRLDSADMEMIASDGLHPSAKEYKKWALKLAESIQKII